MKKYMLASATALALVIAPVASMAQSNGNSDPSTRSEEMKGPPNTNGMSNGGSSSDMKAGRSDSSDSNGAAAAKSTGSDRK